MTIAILAIVQGLIFAALGTAVRIQYSLFRGFDIIIAPTVVLAGESFVLTSRMFPHANIWSLFFCSFVSIGVGVAIVILWNLVVDRIWRPRLVIGAAILILSLGASTAISGAVGFSRGPGLRQVEWGMPSLNIFGANFGIPTAFGVIFGLAACIWVQVWSRTRIGFAFDLWAQNQSFASEIGISRRTLLVGAGLCTGILGGVVGAYGALSSGSTPEGGLIFFLYGAGAALLFPSPLLISSMKGGFLLGALLVVTQLIVSPPVAIMLLFTIVTVILLIRGSSRVSQGLR